MIVIGTYKNNRRKSKAALADLERNLTRAGYVRVQRQSRLSRPLWFDRVFK